MTLSLLVSIELLLRLICPQPFEFAYLFRQIYRYDRYIYIDFIPGASQWLHVTDRSGERYLNFLVTVNDYGFRCPDRKYDNDAVRTEGNATYIHAIGDSMTMGWGCGYDTSYPAVLDTMLGKNIRVLNLGINGFGAIAATEKSRRLWGKFPASHVVYVFTSNDFDDDMKLAEKRSRNIIYHLSMYTLDALRRYSYVINAPLAYYWHKYIDNSATYNPATEEPNVKVFSSDVQHDALKNYIATGTDILKLERSKEAGYFNNHPTTLALIEYSKFLAQHNATLTVVVPESDSPEGHAIFSLCKTNGIPVHMLQLPSHFRMAREGHFNQLGNKKIAEYIHSVLPSSLSGRR